MSSESNGERFSIDGELEEFEQLVAPAWEYQIAQFAESIAVDRILIREDKPAEVDGVLLFAIPVPMR